MDNYCFHIHLNGQVQGIGFRPFVYRLALQHQLKGWVNNGPDGVHIEFNGNKLKAKAFFKDVVEKSPRGAKINQKQFRQIGPPKAFDLFTIVESSADQAYSVLPTADVAMCSDCRTELNDLTDRRFQYAFTTCTYCGPRYSIMHALPYDRERTAMEGFPMCSSCKEEYDTVEDRRYYSQTNSCSDCGISCHIESDLKVEEAEPIQQCINWLREGYLGAVKGIGGYLLMADATNQEAVDQLRTRKYRPTKPFALLYPSIEAVAEDAILNDILIDQLQSAIAPIVMIPFKDEARKRLAIDSIAPGLNHIGVMLPAAPLLELIVKGVDRPLIATSANISNSPICHQEEMINSQLKGVADFHLHHNRPIVVPQDDSVWRLTPRSQKGIWLRRARGLAPNFISKQSENQGQSVLAMGADLKHSFGLYHLGNTFISPYLGDLADYQSQVRSQEVLAHMLELFQAQPDHILVDQHPQYASRLLGYNLSNKLATNIKSYGHHAAHFGAVLGEHDLLQVEEKVLGIIWDGTGYGIDGQIWGGEFMIYDSSTISRMAHLDYYPQILGDKMPKEPRISALCICPESPEARALLEPKFTNREWSLYQRLLEKATLRCSSMGRLFDAVACLLGIADITSYEGEAALQLEAIAQAYLNKKPIGHSFSDDWINKNQATDIQYLLHCLIKELKAGEDKGYLAAKFHWSLIAMVEVIAHQSAVQKLAFSGGVWQNAILVDLAHQRLGDSYQLYFHEQLPPNDECIAYGQLQLFQKDIQEVEQTKEQISIHA